MRFDRMEVRILRLPLVRPFETSFGRTDDRTFLLVKLASDGVAGYGECVADASPYYSAETTATAWHIIRDFLAPLVLGRDFSHPRDVFPSFHRVRGHNMAKAAVEMAAWDAFARARRVPLADLLGGSRSSIESGVSIGIQPTLDSLLARVGAELEAGYRRVKIKIKPGWDIEPVEAIRTAFGEIPLMVDANGAYEPEDAVLLRRLDDYGLTMIEQPLDHDDLYDHAALQRRIRTAVCLDESVQSVRLGAQAIAMGACRVINIKPGRLGGHGPSILLHDLAAGHDIPVWHGGMLESGIGRAHNLHLSSLPNFRLPGDVAASRRYYQPDLIEPPIEVGSDGTIRVPDGMGIGVEIVADRVEAATESLTELRAR